MTTSFPLQFELSNGTRVLVNRREEQVYDFHLTRLNGMKHNFTWSQQEGIAHSETATGLPKEAFDEEVAEALRWLHQSIS